jgi:hypothetical protein
VTTATANSPQTSVNSNGGVTLTRSAILLRRKDGTTLLRLTVEGKPTSYTIWRTRLGYRLEYMDIRKGEARVYSLTCSVGVPITCTCPDAKYRGRDCKHILGLRAALERANKE